MTSDPQLAAEPVLASVYGELSHVRIDEARKFRKGVVIAAPSYSGKTWVVRMLKRLGYPVIDGEQYCEWPDQKSQPEWWKNNPKLVAELGIKNRAAIEAAVKVRAEIVVCSFSNIADIIVLIPDLLHQKFIARRVEGGPVDRFVTWERISVLRDDFYLSAVNCIMFFIWPSAMFHALLMLHRRGGIKCCNVAVVDTVLLPAEDRFQPVCCYPQMGWSVLLRFNSELRLGKRVRNTADSFQTDFGIEFQVKALVDMNEMEGVSQFIKTRF